MVGPFSREKVGGIIDDYVVNVSTLQGSANNGGRKSWRCAVLWAVDSPPCPRCVIGANALCPKPSHEDSFIQKSDLCNERAEALFDVSVDQWTSQTRSRMLTATYSNSFTSKNHAPILTAHNDTVLFVI